MVWTLSLTEDDFSVDTVGEEEETASIKDEPSDGFHYKHIHGRSNDRS